MKRERGFPLLLRPVGDVFFFFFCSLQFRFGSKYLRKRRRPFINREMDDRWRQRQEKRERVKLDGLGVKYIKVQDATRETPTGRRKKMRFLRAHSFDVPPTALESCTRARRRRSIGEFKVRHLPVQGYIFKLAADLADFAIYTALGAFFVKYSTLSNCPRTAAL